MISSLDRHSPVVSVSAFVPQARTWVRLRDPLSEYSEDQALLLCEEEEGVWVSWVPGYGEAHVNREQILKI